MPRANSKTSTTKRRATNKRKTSDAAAKGGQTQALKRLAPLAREINTRLDKAAKADSQSHDHRLAVAIQAASAQEICRASKIKFQTWCEDNLRDASGNARPYETLRQLARVGKSDNPALALEDMRASEAKRRAKSREKAKTERKSGGSSSAGRTIQRQGIAPLPPYVQAVDAARALKDEEQGKLAREIASKAGLAVVTREQAKAADDVASGRASLATVKEMAKNLTNEDFRALMKWTADYYEQRIAAQQGAPEGDAFDIPASLKRDAPAKSSAGKRTSKRTK